MIDPGWQSLLPPLLAIVLAIRSKQVVLSLFAGVWLAYMLLNGWNPLLGLAGGLQGLIEVFGDPGDTRVLMFTLLIGGLIATIEHSGGVRGFVHFLESRRWVHTGPRAQWLAWGTGIVIFIESNITLLVAGSVARPLFDRYGVSREKLAYLIDATSAPVCVMIPLNAWGAVIIGLVASAGVDNALDLFIASIPYNLYAITAVVLAAVVIWKSVDLGPMRAAEERARECHLTAAARRTPTTRSVADTSQPAASPEIPSAAYMMVPILVMILTMPAGLYITGAGDIVQGSGSTAILWSVVAALFVAWIMLLGSRRSSVDELMHVFMKGAADLLPIAIILVMALALGDAARLLGTGPYVAGLAGAAVPAFLLAPLIFLVAAFIAFSVGSSWGTFAIMIPIAIPIATTLDLSAPLFLGAAISGAVFGDHASPISDTTVVASLASGSDHIEHVRTQLPYALLAAGIATVGFLLLGLFG